MHQKLSCAFYDNVFLPILRLNVVTIFNRDNVSFYQHYIQITNIIFIYSAYTIMKTPLSQELIVACCIYSSQSKNEKIWLTKIQSELSGIVGKAKIRSAVDTLLDWTLVKVEYGETSTGRAGRLYSIREESVPMISELHKKYYAKVFEGNED